MKDGANIFIWVVLGISMLSLIVRVFWLAVSNEEMRLSRKAIAMDIIGYALLIAWGFAILQ